MGVFLLCLIFLSSGSVALSNGAPNFSLMFSEEEIEEVEESRLGEENPLPPALEADDHLYLGAFMYLDHDHWTCWVNETPFSPDDTREDLKVTKINSEKVSFLWERKGRAHRFSLRGNQTYCSGTKRVLDGKKKCPPKE